MPILFLNLNARCHVGTKTFLPLLMSHWHQRISGSEVWVKKTVNNGE